MYKQFHKHKDMFDDSDFLKDSPYHLGDNKKVIRKFKCEEGQNYTTEFVGLRSKMYSIKASRKVL